MAGKREMTALCCIMAMMQLSGGAAHADEIKENGEKKKATLDKVVVTATRSEKDLEMAPGSISVVTQEDIEKRNIGTIDQALNNVAGAVATRSKGFMDTHASVNLRGFNGQNRTLVMMDGMVLNDPYSGGVLWPAVSPEIIQQIEIAKGPASSLYGGYAMGGVINMITRMPEKREFTFKSGYGSGLGGSEAPENVHKVYVSYGDKIKDKFSILLSNNYTATDGYRNNYNIQSVNPAASGISGANSTTSYTGAKRYNIGDKGQNGYWHDNLALKMQYDVNSRTKIKFSFMRSENGYDYRYPNSTLYNAAGKNVYSYGTVKEASYNSGPGGDEQYTFNLGVETELAKAKLKFNLGHFYQAHAWYITPDSSTSTRNGGPGKYSDTPTSSYTADLQAVYPVTNSHMVTIGGAFRTSEANTTEYALSNWLNGDARGAVSYQSRGNDRNFALFAQDEYTILDNLVLYGGFRQDWWETYNGYNTDEGAVSGRSNSSFSPKGSLVYKPFEGTVFKISGGKAFRAPTINDLYRTVVNHGSGGKTTAGNSALNPETTLSWDVSVEQKLWQGAKFKATYFENYISDLIYSKTFSSTYSQKVNAGKAESKGVELEAEQKVSDWMRVFANYTYTDAVIKENSADTASVGKKVTGIPPHMVNVGANFTYGPLDTMVSMRYMSKRYGQSDNSDTVSNVYTSYDAYITTDLKFRYKIASWLTASLAIDNVFDEQYYSYYKAPGRSCYGDLTFKF